MRKFFDADIPKVQIQVKFFGLLILLFRFKFTFFLLTTTKKSKFPILLSKSICSILVCFESSYFPDLGICKTELSLKSFFCKSGKLNKKIKIDQSDLTSFYNVNFIHSQR